MEPRAIDDTRSGCDARLARDLRDLRWHEAGKGWFTMMHAHQLPARMAAIADGTAPEIDAPLERHARLIAAALRTPAAVVLATEPKRKVRVGIHDAAPRERSDTGVVSTFCEHIAAAAPQPTSVANARRDVRCRGRKGLDELGVAAYLGAPLIDSRGNSLGAIAAIDRSPRAWTANDLDTLRELADTITRDLELRARSRSLLRENHALRRLEGLYRTLVQGLPSGIVFMFGIDRVVQFVEGTELMARLGLHSDFLCGRDAASLAPRAYREQVQKLCDAALLGETGRIEIPQAGRQCVVHGAPVRDEDGRIIAGMVFVYDATGLCPSK
jgi:hypothetical protein